MADLGEPAFGFLGMAEAAPVADEFEPLPPPEDLREAMADSGPITNLDGEARELIDEVLGERKRRTTTFKGLA